MYRPAERWCLHTGRGICNVTTDPGEVENPGQGKSWQWIQGVVLSAEVGSDVCVGQPTREKVESSIVVVVVAGWKRHKGNGRLMYLCHHASVCVVWTWLC